MYISVSIAVFVTSIVAMTVSVLATGEAVSVAAHCLEGVEKNSLMPCPFTSPKMFCAGPNKMSYFFVTLPYKGLWLKVLRKAGHLQLIQNLAPSVALGRQCCI